MKITFYGYNAFILSWENKKIAIDPGANLYFFCMRSVIPEREWGSITHILVTHGDPDHHWYTDRVAERSSAAVVCNETMVQVKEDKPLMLAPQDRKLAFTTPIQNLYTLSAGETLHLDGISITGIKTTHGPLTFRVGPFTKTIRPGPNERVGWGAIGFQIECDGRTFVNLGDSLLEHEAWKGIHAPDVLMIPIGGTKSPNTMNESEALSAVAAMKPNMVIPCHYNCPALFSKKCNPANDLFFKEEVEKMASACTILHESESVEL